MYKQGFIKSATFIQRTHFNPKNITPNIFSIVLNNLNRFNTLFKLNALIIKQDGVLQ